jgi:hypothetical protein
MSSYIDNLERQIGNAVELSSICRGEWCRSLESKIDGLRSQLDVASYWDATAEQARIERMSNRIKQAYRYLAPDIHV